MLTLPKGGTFQERWGRCKTSINIFLEGDLAISSNLPSKCHIDFRLATHRNKATMGQVRSQIAQALGVKDIYSIQLEASTLPATASIFEEHEGVTSCSRANAIWDDFQRTDYTTAKVALPHAKRPWLRVRKAEYMLLTLPDLGFEGCITPSETATVGDLCEIAAAIGRSSSPRSFEINFSGNSERVFDSASLLSLRWRNKGKYVKLRHKDVLMCMEKFLECSLCSTRVSYRDRVDQSSADCEHEVTACTSCLRNWITASLNSTGPNNITCPECDKVMEHDEIKNHTTDEEFERYDRLLTRAMLNNIPNFRWCNGPKCRSGQINVPKKGCPHFTCNACGFKSCTSCDRGYHPAESCKQRATRQRREENQASKNEVAKISKPCPRCNRPIEKNGGCDHMKC